MKSRYILFLFFLISTISVNATGKRNTPEDFGAVGDGKSDDTKALTKAFNSGYDIYFDRAKKYKISNTIVVKAMKNQIIDLEKASIIRDPSKIGLSFENCSGTVLRDGIIICSVVPIEGKGFENCINYVQCKNVKTTGVNINGSDEMGIAYINCIGVTASYNNVSNCYRDGIHEIYCANVQVFGNKLNNIKDDALACHDYGTDSQKSFLIANGYAQASNIKIYNNKITNAFQGISSISCKNVEIENNLISGTVAAGIAVFNTQAINVGGTARVNGAKIQSNQISNSCYTQKIMGINYPNYGQNSTGRAAIFVGTLGTNGQLGSVTRLANVSVIDNTVNNCGVNGLWFTDIDNSVLSGNRFTNCCIEKSNFSGTVCALYRLTGANVSSNKTVDTRAEKRHNYGFDVQQVTGKVSNLTNVGAIAGNHTVSAPQITNSVK